MLGVNVLKRSSLRVPDASMHSSSSAHESAPKSCVSTYGSSAAASTVMSCSGHSPETHSVPSGQQSVSQS